MATCAAVVAVASLWAGVVVWKMDSLYEVSGRTGEPLSVDSRRGPTERFSLEACPGCRAAVIQRAVDPAPLPACQGRCTVPCSQPCNTPWNSAEWSAYGNSVCARLYRPGEL